jgi:RNA polymerase sigma-70 factor, ECF subfamily
MLNQVRKALFPRSDSMSRCEQAILPHLDSAYNLARWLTRNDDEAEEVVQSACLRAVQFFDSLRGTNVRAWLLTIIRHTFYSRLQRQRPWQELSTPYDEEVHGGTGGGPDPEARLLREADARCLREGLEMLPLPFREVFVLRELEGLSYKEIAEVAGIPIGTVMSRLARARRQLQEFLIAHGVKGAP